MLLSLIFAANMAQAMDVVIKCNITESGTRSHKTQVAHVVTENSHEMTNFETAYAKGFVATMRGYGVVNFVSKESGQAISFYGDYKNGRAFGGNFYMDTKNTQGVSVECAASH